MATSHDPKVVELAHNLTGFQRDILAAVQSAESHADSPHTYGLAVKEELETWIGGAVNHGRLYPNVDELVENGLLEKQQIDRRSNALVLTDGGQDVLDVLADRYGGDDE